MLYDFDLSLHCSVNPTLARSQSSRPSKAILHSTNIIHGCMQPSAFLPRIKLSKNSRKTKLDSAPVKGFNLEFMAEPTNARSMSFVGMHESSPLRLSGAKATWHFGIVSLAMIVLHHSK